jgi:hypothetical protein
MTLFLKKNYTPKSSKPYWPNVLSLLAISHRWQEITGKPDSSSWLSKLGRRAARNNWTTPFRQVKNLPLKDVAQLKKHGKIQIEDIFMFVTKKEEKRAVAQFLTREGIPEDTLSTLFSPEVLANLNEEPEPARDLDLNQRPPPELDLNQSPPPELDEAGDDGAE